MSSGSPRLTLITGPAAVGKMTVAQELQKLTGFRLLVNHMVLDLVTQFFEFGTPGFHQLARPFTTQILDACASHGVDLIMTHGLVFSSPGTAQANHEEVGAIRAAGGSVALVELSAPLEVRLDRNLTQNRQQHKNVSWSTEERLREMESWGRWHAEDGDLPPGDGHIVIDNAAVTATDAAAFIVKRLDLPLSRDARLSR